jgi:hypothetical protein
MGISAICSAVWVMAGPVTPAHACVNPAAYLLWADDPVWFWGVHTKGYVRVYGDTCSDYLRVKGQRKVCGFWGCNYETKADSGWVGVGTNSYVERMMSQDCIQGTHRYRTAADYQYYVFNGEGNQERVTKNGNGIEFAC